VQPLVPILFWSGIVLGRARHHPLRALGVLGFYLGGSLRRARERLGSHLKEGASTLWRVGRCLDRPWARNFGVVLGFGLLTEWLVGGGTTLWVLLFLIGALPRSRGAAQRRSR
jgi:hypothetical protein